MAKIQGNCAGDYDVAELRNACGLGNNVVKTWELLARYTCEYMHRCGQFRGKDGPRGLPQALPRFIQADTSGETLIPRIKSIPAAMPSVLPSTPPYSCLSHDISHQCGVTMLSWILQ